MIDDETTVGPRGTSADRTMYYDYFKWITTLSLVVIGGVFSLVTQSDFVFRPIDLIIVLSALSCSALAGLTGVDMQITLAGKPERLAKRSKLMQHIVLLALGIGAGYFVMMFSEKLFA